MIVFIMKPPTPPTQLTPCGQEEPRHGPGLNYVDRRVETRVVSWAPKLNIQKLRAKHLATCQAPVDATRATRFYSSEPQFCGRGSSPGLPEVSGTQGQFYVLTRTACSLVPPGSRGRHVRLGDPDSIFPFPRIPLLPLTRPGGRTEIFPVEQ
jgi:hypothetical protein